MERWVIVNPAAGRGKVGRLSGAILQAARKKGARAFLTEGPGHATELAQSAPEGARVVAVGGDGTVHEVLKGLAGTDKVLGVVPIGSGNDFARMLGLRGFPWPEALERALLAPEEAIDLGLVNGEPFGASLGVGFDALVAKKAFAAPPFLRGMPRYLYALFGVLKDLRLPEGRVWVDGEEVHRGPLLLLAAMNGPAYGGGIPIAPMADPRDGLLSVVLARAFTRPGVVLILPRLLLGRHLSHPQVVAYAGREVKVAFPHPVPAHADGELLPEAALYRAEVRPLGLKVVGGRAAARGAEPLLRPAGAS
ncbi:MAG: diacylglycerol kinase family lipid kinase [Thermus sp.]|uniref:diacylglycerol/lipid kinase family protein n=1 Tax=Thermus sp. TaxID=275 RepID=UPI0025EFAC51|nr:diacylglycerol kinase family protein [Thermus sp.]MCS7217508.1 diacylglycerol kinase family lipid kinase [Thermus sp.]MCX7848853.1 diacylglycerol kinase family lipid kinase [Thermus sp.]MDW8357448.1 diacylglycerol kinase family lipid kinase [Thermus sp.]